MVGFGLAWGLFQICLSLFRAGLGFRVDLFRVILGWFNMV